LEVKVLAVPKNVYEDYLKKLEIELINTRLDYKNLALIVYNYRITHLNNEIKRVSDKLNKFT
jgi:hypothetical protein